MDKRAVKEINAGSMADIAFLLLIFFLVTTTMDQDAGIVRQLPPMPEDIIPPSGTVIERNVFHVLVNKNPRLYVEEQYLPVEELKDKAIAFLTNSGVFTEEVPDMDLTIRDWIDVENVRQQLAFFKQKNQAQSNIETVSKDLLSWQAKMDAINYFGRYRALHKAAVISLQNDNHTSYEMYVTVQNELAAAINELRDELTVKHFGKTYLALDKENEKERKIIKAVRQIYPQRISEAEPNM